MTTKNHKKITSFLKPDASTKNPVFSIQKYNGYKIDNIWSNSKSICWENCKLIHQSFNFRTFVKSK